MASHVLVIVRLYTVCLKNSIFPFRLSEHKGNILRMVEERNVDIIEECAVITGHMVHA